MAYADFLTALMAFFLLMWLVSGVSPESRNEIAAHFRDGDIIPRTTLSTAPGPAEADTLFSALSQNPALLAAGASIMLAKEADGVRIDLVDTAERPLFDRASGKFTEAGIRLARETGAVLAGLPEDLTVEGHTDAFPAYGTEWSNWDISSARANDARRFLVAAGVSESRLRAVTGLADTRPLVSGQPHLPVNRRVSILVHTRG